MTSLTRVTITGADDAVDPSHLVALSRQFPFVEWGILYSEKREGEPRYPSEEWRIEFEQLRKRHALHVAFHLCGQASRDTLAGSRRWVGLEGPLRIQLNGYRPLAPALERVSPDIEWILQVRDESQLQAAAHDARRLHASLLYDPSGGRGQTTMAWPLAPRGCSVGYAGGITPETVFDVVHAIESVSHGRNFWIDMESGVRTDDWFELDKVTAVLDRCASCVRGEKSP